MTMERIATLVIPGITCGLLGTYSDVENPVWAATLIDTMD